MQRLFALSSAHFGVARRVPLTHHAFSFNAFQTFQRSALYVQQGRTAWVGGPTGPGFYIHRGKNRRVRHYEAKRIQVMSRGRKRRRFERLAYPRVLKSS